MTPFYITAVIATCIYFAEGQSTCNTPSGGEGECIIIKECKYWLTLYENKGRTAQESAMLKSSLCDYDGTDYKVCCPSSCKTPEGMPGKCVSIESCGHLADMLKSPDQEGNKQYLENSRCEGLDQHSVCCGPPPETPTDECTLNAFPPDPKSECCGTDGYAGDRIVGGKNAGIDQYPWLVLIEYVQRNMIYTECGGTLISGRYVLTAGHCVHGKLTHGPPTNIRLGEYDTSNDGIDIVEVEPGFKDCTEGTVVIPIENITLHPAYSQLYQVPKHDIALVRMTTTVKYTFFIRPVCLPSTDVNTLHPDDITLYAAGWGAVSDQTLKSNIKQHVKLPFVELQKCKTYNNISMHYQDLWEGQMCAGGVLGKDTCKGDSGGPLMLLHGNNQITEIVGIVSFGASICESFAVPGVYTNVFKYLGWIRKNILP